MCTVSVVVPTYNRGVRLKQTIESVLNQQFEDFELIVVDDGSTDDTAVVVDEFDDPRVRYLAHQSNKGGSAARNTGIEASEGEYIAFLDDDDEWHPDKLGHQIAHLKERSDDRVAAYCDFRTIRHGTGSSLRRILTNFLMDTTGPQKKPEGGEEIIPDLLAMELPLGGASTLVIERPVVKQLGGFDPDFPRHQDWEFLLRLLRVGKLAYVDEPLVFKHESGRPSADSLREAKGLLFDKFEPEIEQAERAGYDVTGVHRFALAQHYYMEGRFLQGTEYLSGAKLDPMGLARAVVSGAYSRVSAFRHSSGP